MIGDRPIALLAFLAAALLHLAVLVLASSMPIAKLERPTPPNPTRFVVQFQAPAPTTPPIPVPMPPAPAPPIPLVLPVPVPPRPQQPSQTPQPPRQPVEMQVPPRPPAPPQEPVRVSPRPKPIRRMKRPARVPARKPADVKVRQAPRTAPPTPSAPSQPVAPREPVAPPVPTPQQWVPPAEPASRPSQPTAPPVQDLQRQYLAMVSKALQHHKRYPRAARRRGLSGKVVLAFVILPNGQVRETRIVASQSTRHGILHQAALRALEQASPLPPFPKGLKKPLLRVTLPILYELTER